MTDEKLFNVIRSGHGNCGICDFENQNGLNKPLFVEKVLPGHNENLSHEYSRQQYLVNKSALNLDSDVEAELIEIHASIGSRLRHKLMATRTIKS